MSDFQTVEDLFNRALALPAEARSHYLVTHAPTPAIREEVEQLLQSSEESSSAASLPPPPPHTRHFGAWQTIRILGQGGMGTVYLARRIQGGFEQRAAVKVVGAHLGTASFLERFRRERQILAALQHPNIAQLLDGGVSDSGEPYLVMEYVEGVAIDEYCSTRNLNTRARVALFRQVCSAVEAAHRALIVHRDIKPNNILVTPTGVPMLLDFGAARQLEDAFPETSTPLTAHYASPEQLTGQPVTTLSDVYSLGVTLYEILAGANPFAEKSTQQVLQLDHRNPAPPSSRNSPAREALQGDLDNIILKALETDSARRYQSVAELSGDLGRYLEDQRVRARRPSFFYIARKFTARHQGATALGAALLLITAIAATGLTWQYFELKAESERNARMVSFLGGVFGLANDRDSGPIRSKGIQATAPDLLLYAAERLSAEMQGRPDIEATLRAQIGIALAELYYPKEAANNLARARQLIDFKEQPLQAAVVTAGEAINAVRQGDYDTSHKSIVESLAHLDRSGPNPDPNVSHVIYLNGAFSYMVKCGNCPEVATLVQKALDAAARTGKRSPAYALALMTQSIILANQGKAAESNAVAAQALDIQRSMKNVPLDYCQSYANLGTYKIFQGKFLEALPLLDRSLACENAAKGEHSYHGLLMRSYRVLARAKAGDIANLIPEIDALDGLLDTHYPNEQRTHIRSFTARGITLARMNDIEGARRHLTRALSMAIEVYGPNAPNTRQAKEALGNLPPSLP